MTLLADERSREPRHDDRTRMTLERSLERLLFVGVAVLACLMPAQNDTWWHLRAGYEMLSSGAVLLRDEFSHTVFGAYWSNNGWLSQVIFALLHRAGGLPLVTAVCAGCVATGLWFVYDSTSGSRLQRTLLLAGVVSGATITWALRPQVFTLLLVGATVWLTARDRWTGLPVLFWMWANLHSAVGLGLLVLAGAVIGRFLADRRVAPRVLVICALCGLATLATPQGLMYWPDIVASMRRSQANTISEWRAPEWPPAHLAFWVAAVALPVFTAARGRSLRGAEWGCVCAALLLLPVALRSMRNISPFLMVACPAIGVLLAQRSAKAPRQRETPVSRRVHDWLLAAACIAAAAVVARAWYDPPPRMGWRPMSAAAAAAVERCPGPLYNSYVDGGPIIFFAPRQPVLLDSRQDPYPISLVQAEGEVERTGDYKAFFDQYGIRCAAVAPAGRVRGRLERDGWIRRFADDQWVVLERPSAAGGSGLK
jgi:hypothetical protein